MSTPALCECSSGLLAKTFFAVWTFICPLVVKATSMAGINVCHVVEYLPILVSSARIYLVYIYMYNTDICTYQTRTVTRKHTQ